MNSPYLVRLSERLRVGLETLEPERRNSHLAFVLSQQTQDGGFKGRSDESDLYYTSFAVRALMCLDGLDGDVAEPLAEYLNKHTLSALNVIDLMNWLTSAVAVQLTTGRDLLEDQAPDWREKVANRLEEVRTPDGGYAKSTEGASGSTYHSFLVMNTYQLLGLAVPRPNALIQFLYDRQRDDGGFVEIAPMRRSGTNPSAAAAVILQELGAADDEIRDDLAAFLRDVISDEGGFQANGRIPFADSLSTFTAILTAQDLQLRGVVDPSAILRWLTRQLEFPIGGFRAATWDDKADVEYTFYGLGILALISG